MTMVLMVSMTHVKTYIYFHYIRTPYRVQILIRLLNLNCSTKSEHAEAALPLRNLAGLGA